MMIKNIYTLIERVAKGIPYIYKPSEIKNWSFYAKDNLKMDTRNTVPVTPKEEQDLLNLGYTKYDPKKPILKHKYAKDVYLNLVYESRCTPCKGDKFIILKVIYIEERKKTILEINFLTTFKNLIIPLSAFKSKNIYNPYTSIFYNGISIGNINVLDYKDEFYCWYESISRSFDPKNPVYHFFHNDNVYIIPRFPCFEDLVIFNNINRHLGPEYIIHDPNDHLLYGDISGQVDLHSRRSVAVLNRLKYFGIGNYPIKKVSLKENYASPELRAIIFNEKHAGGRPKNQQPKEDIPDRQEKDKKVLYTLIDE